jgi:hypothetical protein
MSGVLHILHIKNCQVYNTVGTRPSLGFCVWNIYKLSVKLEYYCKKENRFGFDLKDNYCLKGTLYYTTFEDSRTFLINFIKKKI